MSSQQDRPPGDVSRRRFLSAVAGTSALGYVSLEGSGMPRRHPPGRDLPPRVAGAVEPTRTAQATPIRYEPVVGTCEDLFSYLALWGVSDDLGNPHPGAWGVTRWAPTVDGSPTTDFFDGTEASLDFPIEDRYSVVREPGRGDEYYLTVTGIDLQFDAEVSVSVLDWRPTAQQPEACRRAWCTVFRDTIAHERQHETDAREVVAAANSRISDHLDATPPSVEVSPGDDEAAKRAELASQVQFLMGQAVSFMNLEYAKREAALHAGDSYPESFCADCFDCDEDGGVSITDVEEWDLQVTYQYQARIDHDDGGFHEVAQDFTGQWVLKRGTLLPGLAEQVIAVLAMLGNFVSRLLGDDPGTVPDFGNVLFWEGRGTASGTHRESQYVPNEDGLRRTAFAVGSARPEDTAILEVQREDDSYSVDWPGIDATGTVTATTRNHGSDTAPLVLPLLTGEIARQQANGFRLDPTGDLFDPANLERASPTYPVETCRAVHRNSITQTITGERAVRLAMAPDRPGGATGTETVTWVLRPRGLEDEPIPDRVC